MLALIGSALVVTATSLGGQLVAKAVAKRPQDLEMLQSQLLQLESEINYGLTPLKDAFINLGTQGNHPVQQALYLAGQLMRDKAFMSAEAALVEASTYLYENTALKQTDVEIFLGLAKVLGKTDLPEHKRHFSLAQVRLEGKLREATAAAQRLTKPISYLGFLSGLALVLIII